MNKYGTDKQAYNSYDGLNNTFILIMPKINSSVEVEVTFNFMSPIILNVKYSLESKAVRFASKREG